jgi:hypothetical protein
MKRTFSLLAALLLTFVGGAASALAQDSMMKAHVPFAFTVSSSTLSAGDYTFTKLSQNVWAIRSDDSQQAIFASVIPNGANHDANAATLVFKDYNDTYFLSEVRCLGATSALGASKAERALERETARNGSTPESIYVLASLR